VWVRVDFIIETNGVVPVQKCDGEKSGKGALELEICFNTQGKRGEGGKGEPETGLLGRAILMQNVLASPYPVFQIHDR